MRNFFLGIVVLSVLISVSASGTEAQRPDAPQYARRGPFAVGTREYQIDDAERPLAVTVWYPAANPGGTAEAVTYRYSALLIEGQALQDAPPNVEAGPYPLVIFSHGAGSFRYQSVFYTEHLASYGFVVMAADHPGDTVQDRLSSRTEDPAVTLEKILASFALRPFDVLRQLNYAAQLNADDPTLTNMIDTENVTVTGHSFGGYTSLAAGGARLDFTAFSAWCVEHPEASADTIGVCTLQNRLDWVAELRDLDGVPDGLWPATTDSRIKAIVPLAPFSPPLFSEAGLAGLTVASLIIVGSKDQVTIPENNAYLTYEWIASPQKALVVFENADHYIFVQACTEVMIRLGFFGVCSDPVWDMQRAHDLINHFATAFLLWNIKDDMNAAAALRPEAVSFPGIRYAVRE